MSQTQAFQSTTEEAIIENPQAETPAGEILYFGLSQTAWIKIGVFTLLFAAVFWSNLRRLWEKTNPFYGEPNWGHATCVPIIGLYYLYVNREALLSAVRRPAWSGMFILIGGLLLFGYGIWPGQNDFVKDFGMVVALFGLVLLLTGWAVMKTAWFPIVFLVCGIPWPGLVYSKIASPLQQLAASVAVYVLSITGVNSYVSGTKIVMYAQGTVRTLNVAEACAGLRSLMTFISVAAAIAFLSARPLWQKLLIIISAVPIAVFCNVMRVSGQGLLDHYVSQQLSQNFAHQFVGLIMLVPAFVMILGVGWVLDQIFVEESDRLDDPAPAQVIRRAQQPVAAPPPATLPTKASPRTPNGPRKSTPRGLPPRGGLPPAFKPPPPNRRWRRRVSTSTTRNPYSQPAFIAAVVVLAIAAIGLNGAVAKLQLHFKKLPVPLRRDLIEIPRQMGDWLQISIDEPLEHDTQEVLGTDRYIYRDYLNLKSHSGQCAADLIVAFHAKDVPPPGPQIVSDFLAKDDAGRLAALENEMKNKTADQRKEALMRVEQQYPDAVVNMGVTYYTGLVDTVAHIPERCYIADGFEPTSTPDTPRWNLSDGRTLAVRFINFEDQSGASRVARSVAYFFQCNGRYVDNPEDVRFILQNLFAKYGYYAKVELMTLDPSSDESARTMTAFLSSSIGELEKTLPDWGKVAGN